MENNKFYITTPIYYPSANFHIGHCYTTIIADAIARFKRLQGYDVFFLTGTDEHGLKIENKAKEVNKTPKEYVDEIVLDAKDLWKSLGISYDKFIRTTDDYHVKAVSNIFNKLYEKGDIYKDYYEGLYCTPCESFWTSKDLIDGCCPDCHREVKKVKEEAYFFKLSKYEDRIRKLLDNKDYIGKYDLLDKRYANLGEAIMNNKANLGKSLKEQLTDAYDKFSKWIFESQSVMNSIKNIKDAIEEINEIDDALVELQKVADDTTNEMTE